MIPGSANPLLLASAAEAGAYQISRSVRLNSSDSAYFSRTPASAGNRKTWTWAGWVKLGANFGVRRMLFGGGTIANSIPNTYLEITNTAQLGIDSVDPPSFSIAARVRTTAVLRDPSAWYHVVFAVDTTQATAANRVKMYINGVEQTSYISTTYPSQNYDSGINSTQIQTIGAYPEAAYRPNLYLDGYLADIYFIDGQALDPTSFTEVDATTGQLVPIAYSGTYGTNGFHLPFSDNSTAAALGTDTSGNSNTWTVNNISVTAGSGNDSLVDTPTSYGTDTGAGGEVRGNYCTLNPLASGTGSTLANGNLDITTTSAAICVTLGTFGMSTGKWYFEVNVNTGSSQYFHVGIAKSDVTLSSAYLGQDANGWGYGALTGQIYNNSVVTNYGNTWAAGDIIGVAFDADSGSLYFYKNGAVQNGGTAAFTGLTSGPYLPAVSDTGNVFTINGSLNFGQRPFAYTAPSGYKALCTANLDDPVIAQPSTVMDVVTYTGNGSTQTISGLEFSPDLVWVKSRNNASGQWWHVLTDAVRGGGYYLHSNATSAEGGGGTSLITGFTSDGFSLNNSPNGTVNALNDTYVAWTWDAGSSTVSNTDGSITSQVRANPTAGFSIVTYTGNATAGATVGHGLNVAPLFFIVKRRDTTANWIAHTTLIDGSYDYLYLNLTNAKVDSGLTAPTSTIFQVGNGLEMNASSGTYVAYCFAPVDGYSSFGSYTGNGSTDGPFVYTGFRPAFILIKNTSVSTNWAVFDYKREGYNVNNDQLFPNLYSAEADGLTYNFIDLLSNGFKLRNTATDKNTSGQTYIYACFSEHSFKTARAR